MSDASDPSPKSEPGPDSEATGVIGRDARAVRAWIRLVRVHDRMSRLLEQQVRRHGLTLGQFDVLTHVARREGQSQQELANGLLVTKGNISHLVDRLEAAGFLERRDGPGRIRRLHMTPAGTGLLGQVVSPLEALIADLLTSVPDQDLATLHTLLRGLDLAQATQEGARPDLPEPAGPVSRSST